VKISAKKGIQVSASKMGKRKRQKRRKVGAKPVYPPGFAEAMGILSVTRCEALMRVIDTAIWLWVLERDPLSIHLLVKSSYQCLRDLGAKTGKGPISHTVVGDFNLVYDWLRHASDSTTVGVDFAPATNGLLLFELIESFEAIFNKRTVYMRAFTAYFAFDFARAVSDPTFRAIAHQELPKGMAADDFLKLSRREFFAKAVDVLRKPIIL
jgi:hypothetical protein